MFHYVIDQESSVPIYRQLADQIHAQIHSGALKSDAQLPTVREMADKLHLSLGTVKKAYDCLQEMGDVEMTRRRGTFVTHVHRDRDSRKQQAMVAIDQMIRKMTELRFSPQEIQIFLNLKMREWGLKWTGVRVTLVTDDVFLAPIIKTQLEEMPNVRCSVDSFRHLKEYPYSVDEGSDVIITLAGEENAALHHLPDGDKWLRAALCPDAMSLARLLCIPGNVIAVHGDEALLSRLEKWTGGAKQFVKADPGCLEKGAVSALAVMAGDESAGALFAAAEKQGIAVVEVACRLDEGSVLYLEERIGKMRDERQLWPAARGL